MYMFYKSLWKAHWNVISSHIFCSIKCLLQKPSLFNTIPSLSLKLCKKCTIAFSEVLTMTPSEVSLQPHSKITKCIKCHRSPTCIFPSLWGATAVPQNYQRYSFKNVCKGPSKNVTIFMSVQSIHFPEEGGGGSAVTKCWFPYTFNVLA